MLGAAEYARIIKLGLIKSEKDLIAQNTELGWIVSGALFQGPIISIVSLISNVELHESLKKFFNSKDFENDERIALTEE